MWYCSLCKRDPYVGLFCQNRHLSSLEGRDDVRDPTHLRQSMIIHLLCHRDQKISVFTRYTMSPLYLLESDTLNEIISMSRIEEENTLEINLEVYIDNYEKHIIPPYCSCVFIILVYKNAIFTTRKCSITVFSVNQTRRHMKYNYKTQLLYFSEYLMMT